ncbi:MATE family efflux transporter [Syntrophomonas wolfei]|jgi:putative MATE family efflux protein|uniref:MATE family efflux transporter n=1 Tax=Syntrophomonas wolfei TaxID=863 RepID=UPI0023F26257|nr:MATE family efflux transporter [Syntrophomonas wolfei]
MNNEPSRQLDMGSDPVFRVLLALAIPAMISMFFQNLYEFVDTMFIAWLGSAPLAAQSLSMPLFYLVLSLGKGAQIGATTLMSQARGQDKPEEAAKLSESALPLLLLSILPLFLLLIPGLCTGFYHFLGARGPVLTEAYPYTFWLVLSFPIMAYVMIGEAISMSHGNTLMPMKAMLIGNAVNLTLDPILMFYLGWGIAGASIATLMGQLLSAVYIYRRLKQAKLPVPLLYLRKDMPLYWKKISHLGIFVTISQLVSPLGLSLLNAVLASFGPAAIGAWNIMARLEMMGLLPLYGMAGALIPYVAFNYGQENWERIRSGVRIFLLGTGLIILPIMAVLILGAPWLVLPFRSDAQVTELAMHAIRIAALAHIFAPLELALFGTAQGLKRPWYSLFTSIARLLVFRYPLAVFFASFWGVTGVYWSQPLAVALSGILSGILLWRLLTGQVFQSRLPRNEEMNYSKI